MYFFKYVLICTDLHWFCFGFTIQIVHLRHTCGFFHFPQTVHKSIFIAPQALLWECPKTVAEQVHREECRRCSISGLLMLIWRPLMGHLLGASCGYRKTFRGPRTGSRSLQIRPNSVRPSIRPSDVVVFFFEPILDQENGILVEETSKKMSKKVILRW